MRGVCVGFSGHHKEEERLAHARARIGSVEAARLSGPIVSKPDSSMESSTSETFVIANTSATCALKGAIASSIREMDLSELLAMDVAGDSDSVACNVTFSVTIKKADPQSGAAKWTAVDLRVSASKGDRIVAPPDDNGDPLPLPSDRVKRQHDDTVEATLTSDSSELPGPGDPKMPRTSESPEKSITLAGSVLGVALLQGKIGEDFEVHDFDPEMTYYRSPKNDGLLKLNVDLTAYHPSLCRGFEFEGLRVRHSDGVIHLEKDEGDLLRLQLVSYQVMPVIE